MRGRMSRRSVAAPGPSSVYVSVITERVCEPGRGSTPREDLLCCGALTLLAPFASPPSLLHLAVPGQHIVQRGEQANQQAGVHEPNAPRACLGTKARQPGCFKPAKPRR